MYQFLVLTALLFSVWAVVLLLTAHGLTGKISRKADDLLRFGAFVLVACVFMIGCLLFFAWILGTIYSAMVS